MDTIIHLAARVHVMHDTATDPLTEFRRTNTAATLNLAQQAAAAGVRRLIYLSSIKVNGESTAPGQPFTAEETPPNLPLSGEGQETVPPLNSSPDKGRLEGFFNRRGFFKRCDIRPLRTIQTRSRTRLA
nr:NAD-dependent epimerase/dehydratase family protein [Thiothrix subterranea]